MDNILKKFVTFANGVWPNVAEFNSMSVLKEFPITVMYYPQSNNTDLLSEVVFRHGPYNVPVTFEIFKAAAEELGYINGYRWGVEYPTGGKKPDLPDDLEIQYWKSEFGKSAANVIALNWSNNSDRCYPVIKFKITDQRYKPADTSYLDAVSEIPESKSNAENASDWYDYEAQKAVALPPVGGMFEFVESSEFTKTRREWITGQKVKVLSYEFVNETLVAAVFNIDAEIAECLVYQCMRPLDHNRKAEADKKRVVDAASACCEHITLAVLADLYDAGYLRMPEVKE